MSFLVMKFGGTSVGSAERIRQSAHIVRDACRENSVVVVVSALAGITDLLVSTLDAACSGNRELLQESWKKFERRHLEVIDSLFAGERREAVTSEIAAVEQELHDVCSALLMLRGATPQIRDVVMAMGERCSAPIFAACLCELGVSGRAFDSVAVLITDEEFGEAAPNMQATAQRSRDILLPVLSAGGVPVVTGYRGGTMAGAPTTLGRGGSDFSATILGAALGCDEIWIWTDVDGVMSADPRICADAEILPQITFAEAIELSYYGAKVIHRKAIRPAFEAGIPVLIKNSFSAPVQGTRISARAPRNGHVVKAVTCVSPAALISLNMPNSGHFEDLFGRLFLGLGHERIDVLFSTQSSSENAIGLLFRQADVERALAVAERVFRTEIKHNMMGPISVQRDLAVIAVLGETMKGQCGVLARLFSTVARCDVSVIAVAQGASEINICFAVPAGSAPLVVAAVHEEFLGASGRRFHAKRSGDEDEPLCAGRCC